MVTCSRCGQPLSNHRQPGIRQACIARGSDPKKVKAAQSKAITTILRKHRPKATGDPHHSRHPRTIH